MRAELSRVLTFGASTSSRNQPKDPPLHVPSQQAQPVAATAKANTLPGKEKANDVDFKSEEENGVEHPILVRPHKHSETIMLVWLQYHEHTSFASPQTKPFHTPTSPLPCS